MRLLRHNFRIETHLLSLLLFKSSRRIKIVQVAAWMHQIWLFGGELIARA